MCGSRTGHVRTRSVRLGVCTEGPLGCWLGQHSFATELRMMQCGKLGTLRLIRKDEVAGL
jgi:hypothetical protein